MRILVTGGGGFVGRRLAERLAGAGFEALSTDLEVDVTRAEALLQTLRDFPAQAVIHLAALSSVVDSAQQPYAVWRVNYLGARNLLVAVARQAPGARVVIVGSGQMYGPTRPGADPIDEGVPLRPTSPYARAKAAADLLAARYAAAGLDVVRARPFNHFGPGQSDAFVVSSFARQIAEMELGLRPAVLEVGELDAVRDFLDVDDVIEAYLALLDPAAPPAAYNICSGVGTSIRELVRILLANARIEPEIRVASARVREADALVGNADRLRGATGWRPRIALQHTLKRVLDDWRDRLQAES